MFDNSNLIEHGTIELGKKNELYEDILFQAKQIMKEFIEQMNIDIIAIEDIQQQRQNVKTFKKLAMLMGVLICLFEEIKKPYFVIPPTKWKSYCNIKGRKREEQKANTILFVQDKFGLNDITEDMADAICLGYYIVNNTSVNTTKEGIIDVDN